MTSDNKTMKIFKAHRMPFVLAMLILLSVLITSCGVYSFTGASIPPEAKTVSIALFPNKADLVQPSLSQTFTDALRDRFSSQTNLGLLPRNGDLAFEGEITKYDTQPVAITGQQTAALIRLSITVNVRFTNKFKPEENFETTFTRYEEYASSQNLSSVEDGLVSKITDALVDEIFNKAVVNW